MKDDGNNLLFVLGSQFALMSLFAMGGANAALPEMHRLAVEAMGWMTDRQFANMYALAQVTPGPNVIVVTLIGFHVAGIAGALVTTLAMCGPTCIFAFFIGSVWDRFKDARWRVIVQDGMVPVSLGLVAASAFVIADVSATNWVTSAMIAVAAVVTFFWRINPLWIFAVAALFGLAGTL
jgi:chromate transporter